MSQFDEDDHIRDVFREIGEGSRVLCDLGARLKGSNSAALLGRGWSGTLVDRDSNAADELREKFPACQVVNATATPQNVNDLVPPTAHFLSIDIDSADWWVWANLVVKPALVVIETNPQPGFHVAMLGSKTDYGCSVEAAKALGEMKGYDYLGRTVVNCFFARKDLKCKYRLPAQREHVGVQNSGDSNVL